MTIITNQLKTEIKKVEHVLQITSAATQENEARGFTVEKVGRFR
jgi:hypothetical protein